MLIQIERKRHLKEPLFVRFIALWVPLSFHLEYFMAETLKQRANRLANSAKWSGKIEWIKICEICNEEPWNGTIAHHENYTKPLDVMWLCRRCHAQLHRQYIRSMYGPKREYNV